MLLIAICFFLANSVFDTAHLVDFAATGFQTRIRLPARSYWVIRQMDSVLTIAGPLAAGIIAFRLDRRFQHALLSRTRIRAMIIIFLVVMVTKQVLQEIRYFHVSKKAEVLPGQVDVLQEMLTYLIRMEQALLVPYAIIIIWLLFETLGMRRRLKGMLRRGECLRCRYSLRAGVEKGCPECGWRREGELQT